MYPANELKSILKVKNCSAPAMNPSAVSFEHPEFLETKVGGDSWMVATNLTGAHMLAVMDWLEADCPDN